MADEDFTDALHDQIMAQAWAFIAQDFPELLLLDPGHTDFLSAGVSFGMAAAMEILHERGDLRGIRAD